MQIDAQTHRHTDTHNGGLDENWCTHYRMQNPLTTLNGQKTWSTLKTADAITPRSNADINLIKIRFRSKKKLTTSGKHVLTHSSKAGKGVFHAGRLVAQSLHLRRKGGSLDRRGPLCNAAGPGAAAQRRNVRRRPGENSKKN